MARRPTSLAPGRHAVYRLAPDLLLVFKPRGHAEPLHAHPHRQTLRVLTGRLRVRTARGSITLGPGSRAYTLAAARPHATTALRDTWLLAASRRR
jgi:quercetin dioxygenase-like cupin family protein